MSSMTLQQALETAQQLHTQQKTAEAEALCRQIVTQVPSCAPGWHLLGLVLCQRGDIANGLANVQKSIELQPSAPFWSNYAALLIHSGQIDAAVDAAQKAILLDGHFADAWVNLAEAYLGAGRVADSADACRNIVRLRPDQPHAWNTLGLRLHQANKPADAVDVFREAVQRFPGDVALFNNMSLALKDVGQITPAIEASKKSISMSPKNPGLYLNLAYLLTTAGRMPETIEAYKASIRLGDTSGMAHSSLMLSMHCLETTTNSSLYAEHLQWARVMTAGLAPATPVTTPPHPKWRIGLVSADFYQHPVSTFIEPILRNYDRERFEFVLFSDVKRPDAVTQRLAGLVSGFETLIGFSDEQVTTKLRDQEIDILIDLAGHTAYNRLLAFARRAAPLQVSYLGYMNTTGLSTMDYRLTDEILDPQGESEQFYTERLHRLPGPFACYQPPTDAPDVADLPAAHNGYVTFGYMGQLMKLTPKVIATWADLLNKVPGSRLLIVTRGLGDPGVREDFFGRFERAGLSREGLSREGGSRERLIFEPDRPMVDWLAAHHRVDILLDPWPFNNHTTALHGLWMGPAMVTLAGDRYAARLGKSVLHHLGFPEWVAGDANGYVQIARRLAGDLDSLRDLRQDMRSRMQASPLMDAAGFTGDFQSALLQMWGARV